ncbi:MAG: lysophospholipid acyltransferase family protein [Bacteroidota bacterium]
MQKIIGIFRAIIRLVLFLIVVVYYLLRTAILFIFNPGAPWVIHSSLKGWSIACGKLLNVQVEFSGKFPERHVLILPNHRSYIDVIFIPLFTHVTHVAKASVKRWPFIGWGAMLAKTVFVDREDKDSRRKTREEMRRRLLEGFSVVVFPEGTTYAYPTIGELRPGMFHVAAGGDIPVMPVAIEYQHRLDAFIDDDRFIPHFIRCFQKPVTRVRVRFGDVIESEDGELLRQQVYAWMKETSRQLGEGWVEMGQGVTS